MRVKIAFLALGALAMPAVIASWPPGAYAQAPAVTWTCADRVDPTCGAGASTSNTPQTSARTNNGGGNSESQQAKSFPSDAELDKLDNAILNREYALFKKIKSHAWTEATAQEWLAFYQQYGQWSVAYYNYALTEWRLGNTGKAESAFTWLMTNCRNHVIPSPPDDLSICADARKNAIQIEENAGIDAYNKGDYANAETIFSQEAALVMPKDQGNIDGWTAGGYMYPYPWYNMSLCESMLQKWDAAFADANEAANRTYLRNDPFRPQAVNRWELTWEQVQFNMAVTAIRNPATMDRDAVLGKLEDAIRFDPVTDSPSYNARALLAQILLQGGQYDMAEREADIALLQHPVADPNQSTAQLVLDTIHAWDLLTACEQVRAVIRDDGNTVDCTQDGSTVTLSLRQNLQIHSSEIRHWPNKCTTLVKDATNPDDGRLLNCQ